MSNFEKKYLKYKPKYNDLKNQKGGLFDKPGIISIFGPYEYLEKLSDKKVANVKQILDILEEYDKEIYEKILSNILQDSYVEKCFYRNFDIAQFGSDEIVSNYNKMVCVNKTKTIPDCIENMNKSELMYKLNLPDKENKYIDNTNSSYNYYGFLGQMDNIIFFSINRLVKFLKCYGINKVRRTQFINGIKFGVLHFHINFYSNPRSYLLQDFKLSEDFYFEINSGIEFYTDNNMSSMETASIMSEQIIKPMKEGLQTIGDKSASVATSVANITNENLPRNIKDVGEGFLRIKRTVGKKLPEYAMENVLRGKRTISDIINYAFNKMRVRRRRNPSNPDEYSTEEMYNNYDSEDENTQLSLPPQPQPQYKPQPPLQPYVDIQD